MHATGRKTGYVLTLLYWNKNYQVFWRWWDIIVYSLIPFLVLSSCNLKIFLHIRSSDKLSDRKDSFQTIKVEKMKTAKVLFTVVLTFLLCHVFRLAFYIYFMINPYMEDQANFCYNLKRYVLIKNTEHA